MKYFLIVVVGLIAYAIYMNNFKTVEKREIVFGTVQIPFSSDPLDFDYYTHHYAFSSVFAKLVSTEKSSEIYPMLASEWSHSADFKVWNFKIRKDLIYSNGDQINIEDLVLNFKRLAFLKNKNNSMSGVLEFLEGFTDFKNIKSDHKGITNNNDILILKFTRPMPDLLTAISFGFYGLAHPSLYDQETGLWINKKRVIASGSYNVSKWDENNFLLSFREESKFVPSEHRVKSINFSLITKVKNSKDLSSIDFLVADKQSLLVDDNFIYIGSNDNLKIGYVKCNSWNKENSPFNDINTRKWFRTKFYEGLKNNNFPITHSFFPLTLANIEEPLDLEETIKPNFKDFNILTHNISTTAKLEENLSKKSIAEIFQDALSSLGRGTGATLIQKDLPNDSMYDIYISGSGIESVNFLDTVRFMFLSKEGIRLPDSTGIILEELKKSNPDIKVINQSLWDQAIIWPIRHYTSGFWFNKKSNLDYSEINFESPAIDFQFLKIK